LAIRKPPTLLEAMPPVPRQSVDLSGGIGSARGIALGFAATVAILLALH